MIDINSVINISVLLEQMGVPSYNTANLALFTTEAPLQAFEKDYKIYASASSVLADFGFYSETYAIASSIFAQNPNILQANGKLIIIPLKNNETIPATAGFLLTKNLITNFNSLKNVTNGAFKIKVDGGEAKSISGLNFSNITSIQSIVNILKNKFEAENIGAKVSALENMILIESETSGASSSIVLEAPESGTDLTGTNYFDIANALIQTGQAQSVGLETLIGAIARTKNQVSYCAIFSNKNLSDLEIINSSVYVQTLKNKIFYFVKQNQSDYASNGIFNIIKNSNLYYSRGLFYSSSAGNFLKALQFLGAYISRLHSVDFSATNSTITMHLKNLSGILPDDFVEENNIIDIQNSGADCYVNLQGAGRCFISGKNGGYSDQILNLIWFMSSVQNCLFNILAKTNYKIPQTENGMSILKGEIRKICEQAIRNGYVSAGKWTSSYTFGNLNDFHRNIEQVGYYIYSLPTEMQNQEERQARIAPIIQIAIKEAGAIHSANIIININS